MIKPSLFFCIAVHCLLLFASCNLFNAPVEPDYLKNIDDEIAWANAVKLTVHINYDLNWGTSNPSMGQITPAKDIRQGYEFEIEFIPDAAYTLMELRAFNGTLDTGWSENINQFENDVRGRELVLGRDFDLISGLSPRGGIIKLRINTTGTITLVPWCRTEPRITRTEPGFPPGAEFSKHQIINIYFNSQLKESSVYEAVKIWNSTDNVDYYSRYIVEYSDPAGMHVVSLTPKTGNMPEPDKNITITIKTGENGIANLQGEWMSGNDVTYSWKTLDMLAGVVTAWGAKYDDSDNSILVSPLVITGDYSKLEVFYTINHGAKIPLANDRIIKGVGRLMTQDIRRGIGVSGIQEYEITIDIYEGNLIVNSKSFKIWNFPKMSVSSLYTDPEAVEIHTDAELAAIGTSGLSSPNLKYVLMNDIVLSNWAPIGTDSDPFMGRFYGNGHTITINSFINASNILTAYAGLFGYVENARIRDLCLEYANPVAVNRDDELYFGGLTGKAAGGTVICNVIAGANKGKVSLTNGAASSVQTYAGMITGYMQSTVLIDNCYTALELEVTALGTSGLRAGGIAGFISESTPAVANTKVMIDSVTMAGIVCARSTNQTSTVNFIRMGGIIGECQGRGIISSSEVSGTLEMAAKSTMSSETTLDYIIGGITGRMKDGQMRSCHFTGRINIDPTSHAVEDQTIVGGLVGALGAVYNNSGSVTDFNSIQVTVWDSSASGNITINIACNSKVLLGGVFGTLYGLNASSNIDFRRCEYRNGQIRFARIAGSGESHVGGFGAEAVANIYLNGCQSRADLIKVDYSGTAENGGGTIGGFIGIFRGDASGCYSTSPIEANIGGNVTVGKIIGGFVGEFNTYDPASGGNSGPWTISRCYAGGNVKVTVTSTQSGLMPKVGGFIGRMYTRTVAGTIKTEDCYATGEVSFDRRTGSSPNAYSFIAGFISELYGGANVTVNRCFSTGSVTNNSNTGSGSLCVAGGLIGGTRDTPTVSNSAALGSSVILSGPGTVPGRIGRVIGFIDGTANLTAGNYARSGLRLYQSTTYNDTPVTYLSVTPNVNDKYGGDAAANNTSGFWTGLGYTSSVWDFSGVSRGYPTLR